MSHFLSSLIAFAIAMTAVLSSLRWPIYEAALQWVAGLFLIAGLVLVGLGLGSYGVGLSHR